MEYPKFATDNSQSFCEALQKGQSTYDLFKLADSLDFEVFLEFADLADPSSALEFHFEPCRARALKQVFRLDRERDLLDFAPTIKLVDQYTEVRVEGRNRDRMSRSPYGERGNTTSWRRQPRASGRPAVCSTCVHR